MSEKEKLLVRSIFSFPHNVFHSYISVVRQNAALCGNGLTAIMEGLSVFIADRLEQRDSPDRSRLPAEIKYVRERKTEEGERVGQSRR